MYILSQEAFVQGTIAGEFVLLEFIGHNLQWHALAVHGQEVEGRTMWMGPVAFLCCNVSPASPPPTSIGIWTQTMQSHKYQNTWCTLSPRGRPPPSVPRPTAGYVDEVACWESGRWGLAFIPGVYADQSPGDSGIRASWSCQPYIRCCSQRPQYGCSWWTPGYPTERRLWVGWLWAEAWQISGWLLRFQGAWGTGWPFHGWRWASGPSTTTYCCPWTGCVKSFLQSLGHMPLDFIRAW